MQMYPHGFKLSTCLRPHGYISLSDNEPGHRKKIDVQPLVFDFSPKVFGNGVLNDRLEELLIHEMGEEQQENNRKDQQYTEAHDEPDRNFFQPTHAAILFENHVLPGQVHMDINRLGVKEGARV